MAKEVIWSLQAKQDLKHILSYWRKRNKSSIYPIKLNKLIQTAIDVLAEFHFPRKRTDFPEVYVKVVKDYKIYFTEKNDRISIITIWDTRQNPSSLVKKIES